MKILNAVVMWFSVYVTGVLKWCITTGNVFQEQCLCLWGCNYGDTQVLANGFLIITFKTLSLRRIAHHLSEYMCCLMRSWTKNGAGP